MYRNLISATARTGRGLGDSLRGVFEEVLDAVYPDRCPLCGAVSLLGDHALACAAHALPGPSDAADAGVPGESAELRVPRCDRCARQLSPALPTGTRCAACRRKPPRFARVLTLGDYHGGNGALREWILALKHGGRRDLVEPLAAALARLVGSMESGGTRTLFVPVPLHPLRRLERGFDQALLLARAVAERTGGSFRPLLQRTRWTVPQGAAVGLSRSANVRAAFRIRPTASLDLVGVRVWLVDDVLTSGATADACIVPLTRIGARRVQVLCLARAGESPPSPSFSAPRAAAFP